MLVPPHCAFAWSLGPHGRDWVRPPLLRCQPPAPKDPQGALKPGLSLKWLPGQGVERCTLGEGPVQSPPLAEQPCVYHSEPHGV